MIVLVQKNIYIIIKTIWTKIGNYMTIACLYVTFSDSQ